MTPGPGRGHLPGLKFFHYIHCKVSSWPVETFGKLIPQSQQEYEACGEDKVSADFLELNPQPEQAAAQANGGESGRLLRWGPFCPLTEASLRVNRGQRLGLQNLLPF